MSLNASSLGAAATSVASKGTPLEQLHNTLSVAFDLCVSVEKTVEELCGESLEVANAQEPDPEPAQGVVPILADRAGHLNRRLNNAFSELQRLREQFNL